MFEDANRFLSRFYEPINESPGQIYTSALSFAPKCPLVNLYANEKRSRIMVSPQEQQWGTCLNTVDCREEERTLYSRDGQCILSWSGNEIVIRDAIKATPRKTMLCSNLIISVDIHPNSRSVVLLLVDGTVGEWDWASESQLTRMYAFPEEYRAEPTSEYGQVRYDGDGSRIVCHWGSANAIFVWSTGYQAQPANRIQLPTKQRCEKLSLDSEGACMVALVTSESESAIVQCWDSKTGVEMSSLQIKMEEVKGAVFANNNKMLVTRHFMKICVWKLEGDSWSRTTTINTGWIVFDVTRSGDLIASINYKDIHLWNAESGEQLAVYQGHTDPRMSLQFSFQGDRLVSTSHDKTLRIWDTTQDALSHASSDNIIPFLNSVYAPSGKHVAASLLGDKTRILLFDGKNGSHLATFTGSMCCANALAFSADSSLLASYHEGKGVFLWDVEDKVAQPRKLVQSDRLGYWPEIVFDVTKNKLAIISSGITSFEVQTWDISSWSDENESELSSITSPSWKIRGRLPHYLKFLPNGPLSFVRPIYEDEDGVDIMDCTSGTVAKFPYDENVHSAAKPAFRKRGNWIVSTRTGRRLLWLPSDRMDGWYGRFVVNGNMIAIGSAQGRFTLLDMSRLSNSIQC